MLVANLPSPTTVYDVRASPEEEGGRGTAGSSIAAAALRSPEKRAPENRGSSPLLVAQRRKKLAALLSREGRTRRRKEMRLHDELHVIAAIPCLHHCSRKKGKDSKDDSASVPDSEEWWKMHVDSASSQKHHGVGVMLTTSEGFRLYYALEYQFKTSNNEAEYESILGGLRVAKVLGAKRLRIRTNSLWWSGK
nr:uncharacterized protein LOC109188642 [Ipomoea batatas]